MKTDREKYLAICQTCSKSKFDRNRGLVCSLTNEHANFDLNSTCPDYQEDEKFARIHSAVKKRVEAAQSDDSTAPFWRPVSIIFIVFGALLGLIGFIYLLASIRFGFSLIALALAAIGLVVFSKGIMEYNKLASRSKKLQNHLKQQNDVGKTDDFGDFDEII